LSEGLAEILNQFVWFITERKHKNIDSSVEATQKSLLIWLTWENACTLGERKARWKRAEIFRKKWT